MPARQRNHTRSRPFLVFPALIVLAHLAVAPALASAQPQEAFLPVRLDAATGEVFLEIDRLDEDILYMVTLATGLGVSGAGLDRGQPGTEAVVRFEHHGPRVLMVRQNAEIGGTSGTEAELRAIRESFPTSVLASLPVVERNGARLVVNATDLFLSDVYDAGSALRDAGAGGARLDRERSVISPDFTASYPRNTEVRAILTFLADDPGGEVDQHAPDGRFVTIEQHHSFMELPSEPFPRRAYDPRTGNSSATLQDYSEGFDGDYRLRSVERWRLVPSDPEGYLRGELVEPVEPIVFHLDPGLQEPYRSAYREGATWWNDAFEAAGFRNAFQVRDLPEGADRMDARYSMIQLLHRSAAGPSHGGGRSDPRTGEIVQGMPRMDSHRSIIDYNIWAGLQPAYAAMGVEPQLDAEAFAMARRRQHVAHEVGHALGFPHNHIAASQGRTSVMDYPFPLIELDDQGRLDISRAYHPGIGYSDSLSVRYAYTWFPTPQAEAEGLEAIVQEALDRGHRFITGGHAGLPSSLPEAHQWVEGETLFDALDRTLGVRRVLLEHFDERAIRPGEPMAWLNQRLAHVYLHHRYSVEGVVKYVGGMQFVYALRGDGQVPTEVIPAARQREALDRIATVLSPEELAVPDRIIELIPPVPSGFSELEPWIGSSAGPALDPLAIARSFAQEVVDNLLHRERMARVVAFRTRDPGQVSLDEVLGRLVEVTWGAAGSRTGGQGAYRRAAERAVLDGLFTLASDQQATSEVRDGAEWQLARLAVELDGEGGQDTAEQAHRERASREIEAYLVRRIVPPLRTGVIRINLPWP